MNPLKLLLRTLILTGIFFTFTAIIMASADEEEGRNSFGFGDLFQSSDSSDINEPVKRTAPAQKAVDKVYKTVLDVALSEEFLNNVLQKYIAPDNFLTELYLGFDTSNNGLVIRGKVKLPKEVMAGYGLPPEVGEICFQSALRLKVTDKGYLAIVFPEDLTTVWPGTSNSPSSAERVAIPTGFLEMAIARTKVYLSTLSGDYSSYERRRAVILEAIAKGEREGSTLTGREKLLSDSRIDGLKMEVELINWRIKSSKLKLDTDSKIVKFVSEGEYTSELNLKAQRNTLLVNPNLDKMFPFLSDVRIGDITFPKNKGSRYLNMTLSSLIRKQGLQ